MSSSFFLFGFSSRCILLFVVLVGLQRKFASSTFLLRKSNKEFKVYGYQSSSPIRRAVKDNKSLGLSQFRKQQNNIREKRSHYISEPSKKNNIMSSGEGIKALSSYEMKMLNDYNMEIRRDSVRKQVENLGMYKPFIQRDNAINFPWWGNMTFSYGLKVPTESTIFPNIEKITSNEKPPIVFIHGSFHSSWCWEEHYFAYFQSMGYDVYAPSLRGTSKSPVSGDQKKIKIMDMVKDVEYFLKVLFLEKGVKPIVIGHSFGGAILMKILENESIADQLSGACFLCSVPPSGNGDMTKRFLKRDFVLAMKIVLGFVAKLGVEWLWLCKELFFDSDMPNQLVSRYMKYLRKDSRVGIDIVDFLDHLPIDHYVGTYPEEKIMVIGAEGDKIVDEEGVKEVAKVFLDWGDLSSREQTRRLKILPNQPHDVMLSARWEESAYEISEWIKLLP